MNKKLLFYALNWIALNDDATDLDANSVSSLITVLLVADMFNKDPMALAKHIVEIRIVNRSGSV